MLIALLGLVAAAVAGLVGAIAFSVPEQLPPLMSIDAPFAAVNYATLPSVRHFKARDGANLAYRAYAEPDLVPARVAVLVHGSSGNSASMHSLALRFAAAGWTAYTLDVRGHGASGRRGDIDHLGQLEEDISDFAALLQSAHPSARLLLAGFSSGGGFVSRVAADPAGERFDGYLLLAPYLGHNIPTDGQARPPARWSSVAVPRIIGLSFLNGIGTHVLDGLPAARFATPPNADALNLTSVYSFRLLTNFGPRRDALADLKAIRKPVAVLVGEKDELMVADQYAPMIGAVRPDIPVTVVPGLGHVALTIDAVGTEATVRQAALLLPLPR